MRYSFVPRARSSGLLVGLLLISLANQFGLVRAFNFTLTSAPINPTQYQNGGARVQHLTTMQHRSSAPIRNQNINLQPDTQEDSQNLRRFLVTASYGAYLQPHSQLVTETTHRQQPSNLFHIDHQQLNNVGRIRNDLSQFNHGTASLTSPAISPRDAPIQSRDASSWPEARSALSGDPQPVGMINDKCQNRNLRRIFKDTQARMTRLLDPCNFMMIGSSLLAAAIPLAALITPETRKKRAEPTENNKRPLANSLTDWFSIQGRVDSMMGWIERSVEHLPNFPRLHPQECVKRSICEAHNEPDKYGAIGLFLRVLFPAKPLSMTDRMDNMEFKVINKYRHAASFGLNKRLDNNGTSSSACKEKYEDCLVSLLDVAQNLMDVFLK